MPFCTLHLFESTQTVPTNEGVVRHVIGIGWHAVATAAIIAIHRTGTSGEAVGGGKAGFPFRFSEHFRVGYHQE